MNKLNISKEDKEILIDVLSKYPYQFYVYGSRAKGTAKRFSDLDLCFQENIPEYEIEEIRDELEKSDISFCIDLVGWNNMSQNFQKLIEKDLVLI